MIAACRRPTRRRSATATLALAALVGLACGGEPDALRGEPARCPALHWSGGPARRNVVLVVSDTTRRDVLGAYGGAAETPAFDRFAADHLLFEHGVSQAPWTKPSMATLFTSLYPSQHQVQSSPMIPVLAAKNDTPEALSSDILSPLLHTLAETLQAAGYRTAAVVSNPWMAADRGFDQGFDHYDDGVAHWNQPGDEVTRRAVAWLDAAPTDAPWFLYVHYMDAHRPHPALSLEEIAAHEEEIESDPRELTAEARDIVADLVRLEGGLSAGRAGIPATVSLLELAYRRGVETFDGNLAGLLDALETHPQARDTAVLITSDHGESLFDRGFGNHGRSLFDDELAVPLAARLPGVTAEDGRVGCTVGLIDVMPTLCTYLGVACPEPVFGASWLDPGDGSPPPARFLASEGVSNQPRHRSIRNRHWKLIWEPGVDALGRHRDNPFSLYRLDRDPGESRDLLATPSDEAERAFGVLEPALRRAVPPFASPPRLTRPIDPGLEDQLRALGYLHEPEL